jgi:hypothetical protein
METTKITTERLNNTLRFLTLSKQNAGSDVKIRDIANLAHVPEDYFRWASKFGLITVGEGKVKKTFYTPEPITARKFLERMTETRRKYYKNYSAYSKKSKTPVHKQVKQPEEPVCKPVKAEPKLLKEPVDKSYKGTQVRVFGIPLFEIRKR